MFKFIGSKLMFVYMGMALILLAMVLFIWESWYEIKDLFKDYGEGEE